MTKDDLEKLLQGRPELLKAVPELKTEALYRSVNEMLDEIGADESLAGRSIMRLELFLKASRWGAVGLMSIILELESREGKEPVMPDDEKLFSIGLFTAYMMVAQQRRYAKNKVGRVLDYLQDALELYALNENQAFPYLRLINLMINKAMIARDRAGA